MTNPFPQVKGKNLTLLNHRARVGELIFWAGQNWKCVGKAGAFTTFERCADRPRQGV